MSDPLLSSLCVVCRACVPKYKCPRCRARTCSLACSQQHKTRAACNGVRDASAYVPLAELRTPGTFDHDFNFLRGIERAKDLVEKELVDARGLVSSKDLRPHNEDKHFQKVWHGDELHHMPVDPMTKTSAARSRDAPLSVVRLEKHVGQRVRALNMEVLAMPAGMTRQRENKTSWNRRTASINWQVEWLIFRPEDGSEPKRILYKMLDNKPLNMGLAASLEWHRSGQRKRALEESRTTNEEPPLKKQWWKGKRQAAAKKLGLSAQSTGSWLDGQLTMQSWHTGRWDQASSSAVVQTSTDDDALGFTRWQFFLGSPHCPRKLVPLSATDSLSTALSGRTIVEFPTIYVISPAMPVPQAFSIGSAERRQPSKIGRPTTETSGRSQKQAFPGREQKASRYSTPTRPCRRTVPNDGQRQKTSQGPSDEAEEGEVNSDGEALEAEFVMAPNHDPDTVLVEQTSGEVPSKSSGALVDYDSSGDSSS